MEVADSGLSLNVGNNRPRTPDHVVYAGMRKDIVGHVR